MLARSIAPLALLLASCAGAADSVLTPPQQARIVHASAADDIAFGVGGSARLTPPENAAFAQLRLTEHAGYRTPLHVHHETDETFLVLEGAMTVFVNGERSTLEPGDYVFIPRGTPHAQGNETEADAIILMTLAPSAFAAFFPARAQLVRETPPDHPDYGRRMRALGERFDIEIVGPSPF